MNYIPQPFVSGYYTRQNDHRRYLGDRVGGHQPEDVRLNPFIELDHGLQLRGIELLHMLHLDASMELLPTSRIDRQDLVEVHHQLVPQPMVDIEFTGTGGGEVGVVNDERHTDQRFVMLLHRLLTRGRFIGQGP